ncbi:MAG: hypothetical protein JNJ94_14955 [Chlorobi bacterium]|nr:hypothetical protein [Chlorobiota bacterium]
MAYLCDRCQSVADMLLLDNRMRTLSKPLMMVIAGIVMPGILLAWSSGIFSYVRATAQSEQVVVEWRTATESGIYSFDIERKSEETSEYRKIARVDARGGSGNSYAYNDRTAFLKPDAAKSFNYRVKAVGVGTETYSSTVTISQEVSSVRRSWGMIKELFR